MPKITEQIVLSDGDIFTYNTDPEVTNCIDFDRLDAELANIDVTQVEIEQRLADTEESDGPYGTV